MIVFKVLWFLVGLGVMLQYIYWAALEVGYGLSLCAPPTVSHDWLFLAFAGAAIVSGDRVAENFNKLTGW